MKSKTASVRLPKNMFEEIDELCDGIGCSRNDWIKDTLQDRLREENGETEDPEPKTKKPLRLNIDGPVNDDIILRKSENKPTIGTIKTTNDGSKYQLKSIQDNGAQIWTEIEDPKEVQNTKIVFEPESTEEEKLPNNPATMRYIDGQWRPHATRYEV